jgi:maltose/moltooligosaccharide transporter
MAKPRLGFWQIWNMNFGFLGIQFGWALQMAYMSAIYTKLDAKEDQIAQLWLAAPVTGLIVQPIIGSMSDRTWTRLGRRRPYFLVGAILSSIALVLMPNAGPLASVFLAGLPAFYMAALLLWVLDASINVSMEPFRAFVADKLPEEQRTQGFAMQSFFIGLGASFAALPSLLRFLAGTAQPGDNFAFVTYSFYAGAVVFLGAVLWTIFTTPEYPPADMEAFQKQRARTAGVGAWFGEITKAVAEMPSVMRQIAVVQFATWVGLFFMWIYFGVATAKYVFGATNPDSTEYARGVEWGGLCFAAYSIVCFAVAPLITPISRRIGRKATHSIALVCGGLGLLLAGFAHDQWMSLVAMVGVGIAWASILSMPYSMLAGVLPPERVGVYMGIFNFFIVLPEILSALTFDWLMKHVLGNNQMTGVMCGGACMLIASALVWIIREPRTQPDDAPDAPPAGYLDRQGAKSAKVL